MGIILIGLAVVAAVVAYPTGLFVVAVVNAIAAFWSNGILANFKKEWWAAPDWAGWVSMLTAFVSVVLIIAALVVR